MSAWRRSFHHPGRKRDATSKCVHRDVVRLSSSSSGWANNPTGFFHAVHQRVVELLLGSRQPSFGGLIARDGYFWPDTPMVIDRPMKRWREYGLPFFAVRLPGIARLLRGVLRDTDNVSDAAVMTGADDYGRPPGVRQRLAPARF